MAGKKIALVIGHNSKAQGAIRITDKRTEYDFNEQLARAIMAVSPQHFKIFKRTAGAGEIARCYGQISGLEFGGTLELHFNSHGNTTATGTETLTSGTTKSLRFAKAVQAAMVGALGLRDRGLITMGKDAPAGSRGKASLWAGVPPAILIEPFFGSNPSDCAAADRHFNALARAIAGECIAFLKG